MLGGLIEKMWSAYFKHYKLLLFIPFILVLAAIVQIAVQVNTTGDFISKDVSLKGGITLTVHDTTSLDVTELESALASQFAPYAVSVRLLNSAGTQVGFLIESEMPSIDAAKLDSILTVISQKLGKEITQDDYSLETLGSSLGASFFKQTAQAMVLAFIFMAIVVTIYFRAFVPSIAVIICAFSDIVTTIAVVNILGIKVGTAGIAAFLMLIGYSVDTDMLLTTRLLKKKEGTNQEALIGAFKTGMMMTFTTLAALIIGITFSNSEVIREIMIILLIGLLIDIINTWMQNTGIILWYVEKKAK
jgi:preprotein translocase subunit SecF